MAFFDGVMMVEGGDRDYRYGFNGMEKDDEVSGNNNSYDFGARMYNPRVGKWFSTDPMQTAFPSHSPYSFVNNSPILYKDLEGETGIVTITEGVNGNPGTVKISMHTTIYGDGASAKLAAKLDTEVKALLNDNIKTMMVNGTSYNVEWDVGVNYATDKAAFNNIKGAANPQTGERHAPTDASQNFARVENTNDAQANNAYYKGLFKEDAGSVSSWKQAGGNSGFWVSGSYENVSEKSAVALHELFHGLLIQGHDNAYKDGSAPGILATGQMLRADFSDKLEQKYVSERTNEQGQVVEYVTGPEMPHLSELLVAFISNGFTIEYGEGGAIGISGVEFGTDGTSVTNFGNRDNVYFNRLGGESNDEPQSNNVNE
ncbi:MAG: hypothetical protein JKY09_07275 [Crocinitomicaceae bacterium]|nr:hypothetical protein [Crocinitomicaceae bacterium]